MPPILPPHPFKDLEDTEFWNQHGINMRLRAHIKKDRFGFEFKNPIRKVRRMNPFQHHGISHLSPSAVNMFTGSPSAWIAKALFGHKFSMGASAWRGIATEDGLNAYIFEKADPKAAHDITLAKFDKLKGTINLNDAVEKERTRLYRYLMNSIDAMIELETDFGIGKPQLPPVGQTFNGQWEVGLPCRFGDQHHEKVDVIGYLDFLYANDANKHTIVDLKTTARIPSDWSTSHAMQASFYKRAHGNNPDVYFVYASPKEEGKPNAYHILKLDDETYQRSLKRFKDSIVRMSKFLALSENPFDLVAGVPHDEESFYWDGEPSLNDIVEEAKRQIENTKEEK